MEGVCSSIRLTWTGDWLANDKSWRPSRRDGPTEGERTGTGSGRCVRCAFFFAAVPFLSTRFPRCPLSDHGQRKRAHSSPVFLLRP